MRIGLLEDVFGGVVLAILLQMAPIERSERMMDAVLALAGTEISFDHHTVTLWPRAEDVAALDPGLLRTKAKLGYRAERLVGAAQYLASHPVSLRGLAKIPEEEAMKVLTAIPGIGKYSAAIIFGQSTPPIDAWSVVIMSELYDRRTPAHTRQEIGRVQEELAKRWGKWELACVCVHPQRYRQPLKRVPAVPGEVGDRSWELFPVLPVLRSLRGEVPA